MATTTRREKRRITARDPFLLEKSVVDAGASIESRIDARIRALQS
jgi:hypothetical protein